MWNVCYNCGAYHADKIIDAQGPYAICPECGFKHSFLQLPLLVVTGASGAGKSTVCQELIGTLSDVVILESDILWSPELYKPEDRYHDYYEMWLRMCKNIAQSGRPVVLFGAGVGVPANLEPCVERRYFSVIHYLALVCDDDVLVGRLRSRPAWRGSNVPAFIDDQIRFNCWFKRYEYRENGSQAEPPVQVLDTTGAPMQVTSEQVAAWIHEKKASGGQII